MKNENWISCVAVLALALALTDEFLKGTPIWVDIALWVLLIASLIPLIYSIGRQLLKTKWIGGSNKE